MIFSLALLLVQAAPAPSAGQKIFAMSCAVGYCHGAEGIANRGPRLKDRKFDFGYIDRVVRNGIPNTAMPGFDGRMKPADLEAVIAYTYIISGNTVPAPASRNQPAIQSGTEASPSSARAEALFFDAAREFRCATCHEWKGKGMRLFPISPGTPIPAAAKQVKRVTLKDGQSFPASIAAEDEAQIRLHDLTSPPPVLRTVGKSDIAAIAPETKWTHAEVTREYTESEISILREVLRQ